VRIVLSRKGFDSQYGAVPSPILPNGEMVSFPIPSRGDPQTIGDLWPRRPGFSKLASDLTGGRIGAQSRIHLDPDLDADTIDRLPGWRPSFGQIAAAQSHLANRGVGPGDLFLFFGWFKHVENTDGHWRYLRGAPDLHVLFGWLQIDAALPVPRDPIELIQKHPWLAFHPHIARAAEYNSGNNTIYVGRDRLELVGLRATMPGAGLFGKFDARLQLTTPGKTRSAWRLPRWFLPADGRPCLSYHENPERWTIDGNEVVLQAVAKGQEFVLDTAHYPKAERWAAGLIGG
jgi:hypothetical protein